MNQCHRTKKYRGLSQRVGDSPSEGGMMSSNTIAGRESVLASVVKAASVFNNILLENCGICTVYCDKQVQYEEYVQGQYDIGTGAMGHLYSQLNATAARTSMTPNNVVAVGIGGSNDIDEANSDFINPGKSISTHPNNGPINSTMSMNKERTEVEQYYREFLFDEESVVRSVGTRGSVDDEE